MIRLISSVIGALVGTAALSFMTGNACSFSFLGMSVILNFAFLSLLDTFERK